MAGFRGQTSSGGSPGEGAAGPYGEMSRILAELPRPRPVRMSLRGKMIATVASAAVLAALGVYASAGILAQRAASAQYSAPSQFPTYALSIAFIVLFAVVMLNLTGRQKLLLAEGEMATAQVTKRWMARNGPNIRYEFTTPLGEHFDRGAADSSQQLSVGMTVPIFYDPRNPKRQVALCASFYEVVLPGKE